jgi:hypothetical protein
LVSIGKAPLDHVPILIRTEPKIGWEVFLFQQSNYDRKARIYLRDRVIDRPDDNDGSTIKGSDHFYEEHLDRIGHSSYQVANPPASSKVSF